MATPVTGWVRPTPPSSCPDAVLAYYCDAGTIWPHWVDPKADPAVGDGQLVPGSDVGWPFMEESAETSDFETLGFVDCESIPLPAGM